MAHGFSGSVVIDRPIDEVFAFLADGTNDPKFSPRVRRSARPRTDRGRRHRIREQGQGRGDDDEPEVRAHRGRGSDQELVVGLATRQAVKDAPAFAQRIKVAIEGA